MSATAPAVSVRASVARRGKRCVRSRAVTCRSVAERVSLTALQVLHEVLLLARRQPELEAVVVVLNDGGERREAAVMVEAALRLRHDAPQRCRPVTQRRRPARLEVVDADLVSRMEIPAGIAEPGRHVAACTARLSSEQRRA